MLNLVVIDTFLSVPVAKFNTDILSMKNQYITEYSFLCLFVTSVNNAQLLKLTFTAENTLIGGMPSCAWVKTDVKSR